VALKLANDPNQILSTVQIGITLVGIFAGAYGGANLSVSVAQLLAQVPVLAPYSQALGLGLVVLIITYLSLVVGELVPKRLGLSNPEKIAILVADPLDKLSKIVSPVVHLLSQSTNLILGLLGINTNNNDSPITEEELKIMLKQGTEAGTFEEAEQDMVERVLGLGDRRVSQIMTTRPDIIWLDLEDSAEINRQKLIESNHNRFPVCQGSLDEEDILEAIVGDLPQLDNIEDAQIVQREDGSWLIDGTVAIEDFKELFEISELPGEKQGNYHTLGGFIITHLGRIPGAADHFEWQRLRLEVVDMDGNRVDKVLVTLLLDDL